MLSRKGETDMNKALITIAISVILLTRFFADAVLTGVI